MATAVWRVRDRATMARLVRSRRRRRSGPIAVTFEPGPPGPPRMAYSVGRRVGGAVVRNRLRRRVRAVVAELAPALAPGAYLLSAGPEAVALQPGELRARVAEALTGVGERP